MDIVTCVCVQTCTCDCIQYTHYALIHLPGKRRLSHGTCRDSFKGAGGKHSPPPPGSLSSPLGTDIFNFYACGESYAPSAKILKETLTCTSDKPIYSPSWCLCCHCADDYKRTPVTAHTHMTTSFFDVLHCAPL